MRFKAHDAVSDDFESHFAERSPGYLEPELVHAMNGDSATWPGYLRAMAFPDPELLSAFADNAPPTVAWMERQGLRFDFLPIHQIVQSFPKLAPVGGGLQIVETLVARLEADNVPIFYQTTARELIQDSEGAVVGVRAVGLRNRPVDFRAGSVILACGGFEGNPEMTTHYIGRRAVNLRPIARGGYYNKGEGIRMALAIGAAPAGEYGSFHAEPLDPRASGPEPAVMIFPYGILVNKHGRRFIDESPGPVDRTYENICYRILEEDDGIAYIICDEGLEDVPNYRRAIRSDIPPVTADTAGDLADALGLPRDAFEDTVARYNAACLKRGRFNPIAVDGLSTKKNYAPAKSNWARPLDKPPFRAWPMTVGNVLTFGGVKVNGRAQVLNSDGEVIPGLYAAGEIVGIYYRNYTGATSVIRGATFGRIAGRDAAQRRNA
jgi:tricarballylate dehydrogenase